MLTCCYFSHLKNKSFLGTTFSHNYIPFLSYPLQQSSLKKLLPPIPFSHCLITHFHQAFISIRSLKLLLSRATMTSMAVNPTVDSHFWSVAPPLPTTPPAFRLTVLFFLSTPATLSLLVHKSNPLSPGLCSGSFLCPGCSSPRYLQVYLSDLF